MRVYCRPGSSLVRSAAALIAVALCTLLFAGRAEAQSTGQWSGLQSLSYIPIHTTMLPNGKVLFYSYYSDSLYPQVWDPATNSVSATATSAYELFCSGHVTMADGRVFITGGHIADYVGYAHAAIFDPATSNFTLVPDMNAGRWYPTNTVLANGDILVVSGDMTSNTTPDPLPQVYQVATNNWRNLTTAQLQMPLYPVMFVAPDGRVFNAGPSSQSRYLDTTGSGAWTLGPVMTFSGSRDYGPGVMYDYGKILEVGGSDPPTATAETIDLTAANPAWKSTGSMNYPRRQHNAVVLPGGKVLVSGGSSGSGFDNSTTPVYPAEMWDPATGQWTVLPGIAAYRGYHSTAFLLPDGRVFAGGGNVGGPNFQIYSPSYLFAGARPTISSAPTGAGYGQTLFIGTPDAASIAGVDFIRLPSVTHTFDQSARRVPLSFTPTGNGVNVTFPASGNVAPPGYYMLFLINGSGVPSVAAIMQIGVGAGPTTGTVTGSVTNTSGAALGGVTVTGGTASTTTLADGSYSLSNVTTGSVKITASLTGYQSASTTITVNAGASVAAPALQLAPTNPGNVSGLVTDTTGKAIGGATVSGAGQSTTTNASGNYTLNNLPAGTLTLSASASGYVNGSASVTVVAAVTTTAPNIALASNSGSATGTVTNSAGGAPIAGASVGYGGGSATTNASGVYTLTGIPIGTVQLVASASGYLSQTQNVAITSGATTTANFSLASGPSAGTLTGKVTNVQTGGIIAGATISWSGGSTTSNSSGIYTLNNVTSGSTISVKANGYIPRTLTATLTGTSTTMDVPLATGGILVVVAKNSSGTALSGANVTLTGGLVATALSGVTDGTGSYNSNWIGIGNYNVTVAQSGYSTQTVATAVTTGATTTLNLTMAAGATTGTVTGSVTSTSGTALTGATVTGGGATATTASNGSYTLNNVTAGSVTITASLGGYQSASTTVTVTAGATATATTLQLAPVTTGTVTGQVVDTTGKAIASASVSGGGQSATTNSTGNYTLSNLAVGAVTISATASGYALGSVNVTVSAGNTTTAPNIVLASTVGNATGTVTNSAGAAISGATVSYDAGSTTTNASGVYTLTGVHAGTVLMTASATGYTTQTQNVTITAGATATANFSLAGGVTTGTVTGTVTNSAGAAISGATVSYDTGSTTTNASGAYTLTGVHTGTVLLTASATGYTTQTQYVTITAGATATANFSLAGGATTGTVTGTVTNVQTGGAIAGATVSWSGGSTTTNGSGVYTLNNVTSGGQTITSVATGYINRALTVTVAGGATATLNLPMATGGKINVVVKNAKGAVVTGASVTLSGGLVSTTVSGVTGSTGTYSSPWLPIGNYTATVSMSGHTTQTQSTTVNTGATTTITFGSF